MKRAFVVRPFGIKNGRDFDEVHERLIAPAIRAAGLDGGTTAEFIEAGNIRTDMFRELLISDIVVADVSVGNANVFYELGIRHALRARDTVLIRAPTPDGGSFPFDLQTDRYLRYDADDPAASVDDLTAVLAATLASGQVNSPVFNLLPGLEENELSEFLPVPAEFGEHVRRAAAAHRPGDLDLLADEIVGLAWERTGLAAVGRAQFAIGHFRGARRSWERVREFAPDDVEANTILGTVYQKLGLLTESDLALDRVLHSDRTSQTDRAEVLALQGRNAKVRWQDEWRGVEALASRQTEALRSSHLEAAADSYRAAFDHDLNAYYPGLNALSLHSIRARLAEAQPEVWLEQFDEDENEEGGRRLAALERLVRDLEVLVRYAATTAADGEERWTLATRADLACLVSKNPNRVANAYRKALAVADHFGAGSMRNQLQLYADLGLFGQNVAAAIEVLGDVETESEAPRHVVFFAGHRIDTPGRSTPRFPAGEEHAARTAIAERLEAEIAANGAFDAALAGAASGGDIIFLEVCAELGVPIEIYLAIPEADYVRESVADAGPGWVDRFRRLCDSHPVRILSPDGKLPGWLGSGCSIWQRNNLWILHNALAIGADRAMLLALWNGEPGDGAGGTQDLLERTRAAGAKVVHIDTNEVFSL